jgi:hypothetical protein
MNEQFRSRRKCIMTKCELLDELMKIRKLILKVPEDNQALCDIQYLVFVIQERVMLEGVTQEQMVRIICNNDLIKGEMQ